MTDRWTGQLSAYVDGEIDAGERGLLAAHLETCAECERTVRQLENVREWARSHPGRAPSRDVWPAIAATIRLQTPADPDVTDLDAVRARRRRPVPGVTVLRTAAAAAMLFLAGAAGWWLRGAGDPVTSTPPAIAEVVPGGGSHAESALLAAQRYSTAIAELERVVLRESGLDTSTARVIREKLGAIDRAITEARQAIAAEPENAYLAEHYARMMGRKLALLRHASRAVDTRART